jgi:hypothetical protein
LAASEAAAQQATGASLTPSFHPNRLGASTVLTLAFQLGAGETSVPPPLERLTLRLPVGLRIGLRGVRTCAPAQLRRGGPARCPGGSLVGRGHTVLEVHAGSQQIPEDAFLRAFRAPDESGQPALAIFAQGETPLQQQTVSTAVLAPDSAPYGSRLIVSMPPIPTLMYEPNASTISLSLTIGSVPGRPRAHAAAATITVPHRCPAGGFPFAADFLFADFTTAHAGGRVRCP